jgi:hypothetical protein
LCHSHLVFIVTLIHIVKEIARWYPYLQLDVNQLITFSSSKGLIAISLQCKHTLRLKSCQIVHYKS